MKRVLFEFDRYLKYRLMFVAGDKVRRWNRSQMFLLSAAELCEVWRKVTKQREGSSFSYFQLFIIPEILLLLLLSPLLKSHCALNVPLTVNFTSIPTSEQAGKKDYLVKFLP